MKIDRISFIVSLAASGFAQAAFVNGDLAVVRLDGKNSKTADTAAAVTIDVYSPDGVGGYTLTGSHPLASAGAAALTLTANTKIHDGILRQSADGQYLTLAGYRAGVGAATFTATSTAAPRVIGRIDGNWAIDASTTLGTDYNSTAVSSVVTDNGQRFWVAGSGTLQDAAGNDGGVSTTGGLRYVAALGANASTHVDQQTTGGTAIADSQRNALIAGGQLYITTASAGSYGNRGLYAIGTGLPTGGTQTATGVINNIEGVATDFDGDGTGKAFPKSDAVLLDLNPAIPGIDTAYSTGGKADYQKWIKDVNGVWQNVFQKSFVIGTTEVGDINTLTAAVNGSAVTLFAATFSGVYQMADPFGYSMEGSPALSTTPLFSAATNTQFRGLVALVPEPQSLALVGSALLIGRRRRLSRR